MITIPPGRPSPVRDYRKVKLERPPGAGGNWAGVRHADMVDAFRTALDVVGYSLVEPPTVHLSGDGYDMIAGFKLKTMVPARVLTPVGWTAHGLTIKTSNARRHSLTAYWGMWAVGWVGMPLGCAGKAQPFTGSFNLEVEVGQLVKNFDRVVSTQLPPTVDRLESDSVGSGPNSHGAALLLTAGRKKLMPWSRIGQVDANFDRETVKSAAVLYRNFCAVARQNPPAEQTAQCLGFLNTLKEKAVAA